MGKENGFSGSNIFMLISRSMREGFLIYTEVLVLKLGRIVTVTGSDSINNFTTPQIYRNGSGDKKPGAVQFETELTHLNLVLKGCNITKNTIK